MRGRDLRVWGLGLKGEDRFSGIARERNSIFYELRV